MRATKTNVGVGITINYVWSGGNMVYEYATGFATTGIKHYYGLTLFHSSNGNFYLYNGHGDVVQLIDQNRNIIRSYEYDAFGNEKEPDASDTNYFRYVGQYYDFESGTYYLRARYYDPANGRFTQQDAWGYLDYADPLRLNLYTYCFNNPVNFVDPSGHDAQLDSYIEENYAGKTTITIVVRQPKDGSDRAVQGTSNVGHTFIRLEYYQKHVNGNMVKVVRYIGFYPEERLNSDRVAVHNDETGCIRNDSKPRLEHRQSL